MSQWPAWLDAWWTENPLLTTFGLALGLLLAAVLTLALLVLIFPGMRILYRAFRRVLWIKFGTTRNGPPLPSAYRDYLGKKRLPPLLIAAEGAAFGRTGVIFLTSEEIGFVSLRFGMINEVNVACANVTEAKISKGSLFDYVTVTTRERAETLRLYRSDRDVGQEFFNHLQLSLGAVRFRKP